MTHALDMALIKERLHMMHMGQPTAASFDRRIAGIPRRWLLAAAVGCGVIAARPVIAAAQLPNLVEVSAQYTPPVGPDGHEMTQAQVTSYQVMVSVPIRLSGERFLIPGLSYHVDSVAHQQTDLAARTHTTFHAPEFAALFVQLLPRRWSVSLRASVGVAGPLDTGPLDAIDRRMLRYGALALVSRAVSERLTIGAGALVTAGFGTIQPLPAMSLRWRPRDELRVDLFVPSFGNVRYAAWNRLEIGAQLEVTGSVYAIRSTGISARWPCAAQPVDDPATAPDETMANADGCLDHATYTVASAGVLTGVRLTSTIWLTVLGGVSFYRHAEQQDRGGDTIPGGAHDLPRALVLRTSLAWRLPGT